jgi:hypothetical protein
VTVALLWMFGALLTFAFLRRFGLLPAAMSAALFALTPYVIFDAFVRAAYAEFAAIMLAPGVLWATDRVLRDGRVGAAPIGALVGGFMIVTHLPTVVVFAPVFVAYALFVVISGQTTAGRVASLAAAGVVAAGVASFYLVPALQELPLVAVSRLTTGYLDYRSHFLEPWQWVTGSWGYGLSVEGANDDLSFQIGIVQCVVIVVAAVYAVRLTRRRRARPALEIGFWLGVIGVSLFLTSPASEPVWSAIAPLTYLQFPWRALMVVPIACAVLAARLLSVIPSPTLQALVVIAIVSLQYQLSNEYLRPSGYIDARRMNIDDPRWACSRDAKVWAFLDRGFTPLVAEEEPPRGLGRWSARTVGPADIVEVAAADHRLALLVRSAADVELQVHSRAFPGWRVLVAGKSADVRIEEPYGFMTVRVPPGEHLVEARFENTRLRRNANYVTAVSMGLCLAWWIWCVLRERRQAAGSMKE